MEEERREAEVLGEEVNHTRPFTLCWCNDVQVEMLHALLHKLGVASRAVFLVMIGLYVVGKNVGQTKSSSQAGQCAHVCSSNSICLQVVAEDEVDSEVVVAVVAVVEAAGAVVRIVLSFRVTKKSWVYLGTARKLLHVML